MWWSRHKKSDQAARRLKRRRRRQRIARVGLLLFLFFAIGAAAVPPDHDLFHRVQATTATHQFDFINWETQSFSNEIFRRLAPPPVPQSAAGRRDLVQRYLDYEQQVRDIRAELTAIYAAAEPSPGKATALEARLSRIQAAQAEIAPQVETILAQQIESVLRDEGFAINGQVITPLAFRFIDPPTALIVSPRDRIERIHFVGLEPGLEERTRAEIEAGLEGRGDVSTYVTNIGGLASYPTMVISYPYLPWLIEVVAHEWVHNYFFTFPTNLAWGYEAMPHMRTLNETTADLVGKEIGRAVILRYYPDWVDHLPPLDDSGQPAVAEPGEFDLAMRRIRQRVDDLLAEGAIEEAEAYMEQERLKLVEKGYNLRKLNQAYFAFHGAYTLGPASIDPTGQHLRQLRASSETLKAFTDRVGWLNNYDDFLAWLAEEGIPVETAD
ncbi:MAG: hypothetical protein R3264_01065 [Anaerolineae bacterium]|nr:hypothetical protein [Anaerolineae bacterium]